MSEFVKIGGIITDLIETTGDETLERLKPTISRWVKTADLNISTKRQFKRKYVVLPVLECNRVKLPDEWVKIEYVLAGDQSDNVCNNLYQFSQNIRTVIDLILAGVNGLYTEQKIIYWSNGDLSLSTFNFEIQYDSIIFPYQAISDQSVTVIYLGYETDEQGFPMILKLSLDAVTQYVKIQLMKREKWRLMKTIKGSTGTFDRWLDSEDRIYHRMVQQARGSISKSTPTGQAAISALYKDGYSGANSFISQIF